MGITYHPVICQDINNDAICQDTNHAVIVRIYPISYISHIVFAKIRGHTNHKMVHNALLAKQVFL